MTRVVNAMTVDVEDYFHASAFDRVVSRSSWAGRGQPRRPEHRNPAGIVSIGPEYMRHSSFSGGWRSGFRNWCATLRTRGHEIASHGFHHQLIYLLTPDQFREDVRRAKATIEEAAGCTVRGYRAPSFSIVRDSLWALDVLIEEGHSYDASMFPIRHDRYGIR